jgi:alpha-galactosidase
MLGAGSFFTDAIMEGLCGAPELFGGSTFVLMDADPQRLRLAEARIRKLEGDLRGGLRILATTDRREAVDGCDYVVTSCEKNRVPYWIKDLEIPQRHGVRQFLGENGGPGGQAHAMRNITMFMGICRDLRALCPKAWLLNFTNPMSFVCTYLRRHGGVKALGFCHQVHGSFGVVAEMLGFEPGELEVISGGVNHLNWLIDIRRRGTGASFKEEFFRRVRKSKYWRRNHPRIPNQRFTRDILETFGVYPIGYDDHICEYLPFFYPPEEWESLGYEGRLEGLRREMRERRRKARMSEARQAKAETRARGELYNYPFPRDGHHPHYREKPTEVMEAFAANRPLYLTSIVIPNQGAIDNLPWEALVDVPALAFGGEVRGVHVGSLPTFAMEICRRQITIHELLTEATVTGDRQKVVQSMALDPYVRSIRQAERITDAFLKYYRAELPQF